MTADVELYVGEGSRFVRAGDARPARPVPPIPTPVQLPAEPRDADGLPPGARIDAVSPSRVLLPVARCAHGHFQRWATLNCSPCIREEARRGH